MFFSYDIDNGIEFHDTEEAAKKRAEGSLYEERAIASDYECGWNENITDICYGKVIETVVQTKRKKAPEDSIHDEICDFDLKKLFSQENKKEICEQCHVRLKKLEKENKRLFKQNADLLRENYDLSSDRKNKEDDDSDMHGIDF